jgi:hypothetical protein
MNRNLKATAAVLGIRERELRAKLRELKLIANDGTLLKSDRIEGRVFLDTRSRWNPTLRMYQHYGVIMTTEAGVSWLAEKLGITVTTTRKKDSAA